jgi:hypothetical protein
MVAERSLADSERGYDDQQQHEKINHEGINVTDGKAESRLIEKIDFLIPSALDCKCLSE